MGIIIALPWLFFSEGISYDLFIYKDFNRTFIESLWGNQLVLYFFSKILFFVDANTKIKVIHFFCVLPLLVYLSKNCAPKYTFSVILFLFFSLFSGQFRMCLSLFFLLLSNDQKASKKLLLAILALASHYVVAVYFLYLLFSKQQTIFLRSLMLTGIFLGASLIVSYETELLDKVRFYFSKSRDYSLLFFLPISLLYFEFNNLRQKRMIFILAILFTLFTFHYYDLSSRITELVIFSMLIFAGKRFSEISHYTIILAVLFFIYRLLNITFFTGQLRFILLDYFF